MAYSNSNRNRTDVLKRIFIVRPAGAKFNNASPTDKQAYLNGVAVPFAVFAVFNSTGIYIGHYLGLDGTCTASEAAVAGTLSDSGTVATQPISVDRALFFYDTTSSKVRAWHDTLTHTTVCNGAELRTSGGAKFTDLNAMQAAVIAVLSNTPAPPDSANGFTVPTDGATLILSGNAFTIESGTSRALINGVWANGRLARKLKLLSNVVYALDPNTGHWWSWSGAAWTDTGTADPTNPATSAAWAKVSVNDGSSIVDSLKQRWSLGTAAGIGYLLCLNEAPYNGGWAKSVKLDVSLTFPWHENPSGLGWIREDSDHLPNFWADPIADPENPTPPPVGGPNTTTGSISGNSNILTVADTTPFTDALIAQSLCWVIVEIGTEGTFNGRAAGMRGTPGVGGAWPWDNGRSSIPTYTPGGGNGSYDWVESTGVCYFWVDGHWYNKLTEWDQGSYQDGMALPKSLVARVTGVNRSTKQLTLDRNAFKTATNANVYLDGAPIIQNALNNLPNGTNSDDPSFTLTPTDGLGDPFNEAHISRQALNLNTLFPGATSVAMGGLVRASSKKYIRLTCNSKGSFTVYTPKGTNGMMFEWYQCRGVLSDFVTMRGNHYLNGYGIGWAGSTGIVGVFNPGQTTMISPLQAGIAAHSWYQCSGCIHRDADVYEVNCQGTGGLFCGNCRSVRVYVHKADPTTVYVWHIGHQQANDCHFIDCGFESDHVCAVWSNFQTDGCHTIRPYGRNCIFEYNNCGGGYMGGEDQDNPGLGGGERHFTANSLVQIENYGGYRYIYHGTPTIECTTSSGTGHVNNFGSRGYVGRIAGTFTQIDGYQNSLNDTNFGCRFEVCPGMRFERNKYFGKDYVPGTRTVGSSGLESNGPSAFIANNEIRGRAKESATNWAIWANNGAINGGGNVADSPMFFL